MSRSFFVTPALTLLALLAGAVTSARAEIGGTNEAPETGQIIAPPRPDDISVHPVTVSPGENAVLRAPDWPASWANWYYSTDQGGTWTRAEDGYFFPTAHAINLQVTHTSRAMDGWLFRVALDGAVGPLLSEPGTLTVAAERGDARLMNLSARAWVGNGADALFVGFVVQDPGNGFSKGLMLRAVGPTLAQFGLDGVLQNPRLTLHDSTGRVLDSNSTWTDLPVPVVEEVAGRVGAFALPRTSADSTLLWAVPPGAFTTQITSTTGSTGVALAEIYDSEPSQPTRLINLSARAYVGTGGNILIAGLVVGGSGTKTVLVRGVGPGLAKVGVAGPLSGTTLSIFDGQRNLVETRSGWSGNSAVFQQAFLRVGAFALDANSADTAVILTLPAGAYTVQLSGMNGATGVGLIEIYEIQ